MRLLPQAHGGPRARAGRDADAIDAYTAALDHFLALGGDGFEAAGSDEAEALRGTGDDGSVHVGSFYGVAAKKAGYST